MAKKNKFTEVGVKIGAALGKADKQARKRARKVAAASKVAKEELHKISKQVDALTRQLAKTTNRLKKVISS
jgi:polyhydroxyalkanoate synthesis regulator phasin